MINVTAVVEGLNGLMPPEAIEARAARAAKLVGEGISEALALRIADLPALTAATDAVLISDRTGKSVTDAAQTYFAALGYFQLDRVVGGVGSIKVSDYFERLALDRALDTIGDAMRRIAAEATTFGSGAAAVSSRVKAKRAWRICAV